MTPYRIFLSSPGDCNEERKAVHALVARMNADPLVSEFTCLEVVAWDWGAGVPLDTLSSPQVSVNKHLPTPENCDLFLGIFNSRFGTTLPASEFRKHDGTAYKSGSEYEFNRAWRARRQGSSRPEILMYRRLQESSAHQDNEQWENLERFFQQPPFSENGQWTGSVHRHQSQEEFTQKFEGHLRKLLSQRLPGTQPALMEWLNNQASLLTANAGPRYTSDAHVETDIGHAFDWLLARQPAIAELDKAFSDVWKHIELENIFSEIHPDMELIAKELRADIYWQSTPNFTFMMDTLAQVETHAWTEYEAHERSKEQESRNDTWRYRGYSLRQAAYTAREARDLLRKYSSLTRQRIMLLTGKAGQGKTHTLVHEVKQLVSTGGLALGVLGQTLSHADTLWDAICRRVGWQGTHDQLLDKLENEAANRNQRTLLVMDALNETPDRRRWRNELAGMIQEVLRRPHLALVISVRTDYLEQTLPLLSDGAETPWVKWEHLGFAGIEPDALLRYFEHYGVKAPVAPPLGEFGNPLYVQLLARSMQGHPLQHWLPSWLEVWRAWMVRLEEEAKDRLSLDNASRQEVMRRTMSKLAQAMLKDGRFNLPRRRADDLAREMTGTDGVIAFLCSSGALIDRLEDDEDVVEFGFERLSDTFLADRLLAKLFEGKTSKEEKLAALRTALAPGGDLHPLASRDYVDHPLYFRRSGLLEALCLAVPLCTGAELPTLLPDNDTALHDWELSQAFRDSLRWRCCPEEFGMENKELLCLWQHYSGNSNEASELDELIGFSLIPGHPFAMEQVIHPRLLIQKNPGERDAIWSINLVPLWGDEHSNLRQMVVWARDANLHGVHTDVALPAARLLGWICATSQKGLRLAAMKGLTRLLAACPQVIEAFLPDFLAVNDAYVLEAVLVAVWGLVLDGHDTQIATLAAQQVYESQFSDSNARWCHITLRHYARRIVEEACRNGWLPDVPLCIVRPPYRSTLPFDTVPSNEELKALDTSKGFGRIVFSSTNDDFYRYVMGGNSASLDFLSQPLANSSEPARPFARAESSISRGSDQTIFDLALAARFVAWNCLNLGWTADRFEDFDSGYFTRDHNRMGDGEGTERIGKKYQWISWYTLLAFLSDNYAIKLDWNKEAQVYDTPDQVHVNPHDPARWLQIVTPAVDRNKKNDFWDIPSLPAWPLHKLEEMKAWVASSSYDLPPEDVIGCVPSLPKAWGDGPWLRLAAEHIWQSNFAPGGWGIGKDYYADLWWQCWPFLIYADDLPRLLENVNDQKTQKELAAVGRFDLANDWHTPLPQWPTTQSDWDHGFRKSQPNNWHDFWLPVNWRPMIGECGHPDRRDDHAPVLLPTPSLFREWGLELDLRSGLILHQGEPIFGLAGWVFTEHALFAHLPRLHNLLDASGYALIWRWCGERRAFMNLGSGGRVEEDFAWADYHGISYLGSDSRVQCAWSEKKIRRMGD
ncbi:MAG: NACHT domain-containing protein [Fluviibacter sp.]